MFRELDDIEIRIKHLEIPHKPLQEQQVLDHEVQQSAETVTEETELPVPDVKKKPDKKQKIPKEKKRHLQAPSLSLKRTKKSPHQKKLSFLHRKTSTKNEELTPTPELQEKLEEAVNESLLTQSTFSLRFDDKGNLAGFTLKKPKLTKEEKRRIKQEAKAKVSSGEAPPAKGIKGKITRIFSKIRRRSSKQGGAQKSGIGGKIKGLIPRRSKK